MSETGDASFLPSSDYHPQPKSANLPRPRPRLFFSLLLVFALWIALLVVLKLATS